MCQYLCDNFFFCWFLFIFSCGSVRLSCNWLPVVCCLWGRLFYYDYYLYFLQMRIRYLFKNGGVWCCGSLYYEHYELVISFFSVGFLLFLSLEIVQSSHVYESELNKNVFIIKFISYDVVVSRLIIRHDANTNFDCLLCNCIIIRVFTMSLHQIKSEPKYLLIVSSNVRMTNLF